MGFWIEFGIAFLLCGSPFLLHLGSCAVKIRKTAEILEEKGWKLEPKEPWWKFRRVAHKDGRIFTIRRDYRTIRYREDSTPFAPVYLNHGCLVRRWSLISTGLDWIDGKYPVMMSSRRWLPWFSERIKKDLKQFHYFQITPEEHKFRVRGKTSAALDAVLHFSEHFQKTDDRAVALELLEGPWEPSVNHALCTLSQYHSIDEEIEAAVFPWIHAENEETVRFVTGMLGSKAIPSLQRIILSDETTTPLLETAKTYHVADKLRNSISELQQLVLPTKNKAYLAVELLAEMGKNGEKTAYETLVETAFILRKGALCAEIFDVLKKGELDLGARIVDQFSQLEGSEVCGVALETLGVLGSSEHARFLERFLEHSDSRIKLGAAKALGSCGDFDSIMPLYQLQESLYLGELKSVSKKSIAMIQSKLKADNGLLSLADHRETDEGLLSLADHSPHGGALSIKEV